jgi:tetratricopeptide (TPR) repeat protein
MKYSSPLRAAGKRTGTRQNRSALRRAKLKGRYYWSKRTIEGLEEAINYFRQSISIDPSYAEAYSGLAGSYALAGDWDMGFCRPRRARLYAWHLHLLGHSAEGMFEMRRAERLDRFLRSIRSNVAEALFASHLFEQSVLQSRKTLALDPNFAVGHFHWLKPWCRSTSTRPPLPSFNRRSNSPQQGL